jgi:hypothetical protein
MNSSRPTDGVQAVALTNDARAEIVFRRYDNATPRSLPDDSAELEALGERIADEEQRFYVEFADAIGVDRRFDSWETKLWHHSLLKARLSPDNVEHARKIRRQFANARANVVIGSSRIGTSLRSIRRLSNQQSSVMSLLIRKSASRQRRSDLGQLGRSYARNEFSATSGRRESGTGRYR